MSELLLFVFVFVFVLAMYFTIMAAIICPLAPDPNIRYVRFQFDGQPEGDMDDAKGGYATFDEAAKSLPANLPTYNSIYDSWTGKTWWCGVDGEWLFDSRIVPGGKL